MLSGGGVRRSGCLLVGLDLLVLPLLPLHEQPEKFGSGLLEEQRVESLHGLDGVAVGRVEPFDRLGVLVGVCEDGDVLGQLVQGARRLEGRGACRFGPLLGQLELDAEESVDLGVDAIVQGVRQLDVTLVDGDEHGGAAEFEDVRDQPDEVDDPTVVGVVVHWCDSNHLISRCSFAEFQQ